MKLISWLAVLWLTGGFAQGVDIAGVHVDPHKTVDGQTLSLNGAGLRTVFIVKIKAYVAAFYSTKPLRTAEEALAGQAPLQVDFTFLRAVSAPKMQEAWDAQIKASLTYTYPTFEEDKKRFVAAVGALPKGGTQSVVFVGEETRTYEAGVLKSTIHGRPFQRAFLSLWFGPKPVQDSLKRDLLGQDKV